MTTPKTTTKTTTARTAAKAPAKPEFLIVEHNLKCQTSAGELSLDLRVGRSTMKKFTAFEGKEGDEALDFLFDEVLPSPVAAQIEELGDFAEEMKLAMAWVEAVGERLGVTLEKLRGSSDS
ncbi:MAG: hypothetical protein HIU81_03915 [Acidobacteria bacterium]|nr:hypothetical protein [Acidobacteriota bacterium]